MLRIGLLGHGYMGQIRRRVIETHAEVALGAVFHTQDVPGLEVSDAWESVVDAPDIDAVFVCLPNHLTCEATCRALANGKHVLAEKPPGVTLAEAQRMQHSARASGRVLKFAFNLRHHPAIADAKALITSGALGRVLWLRGAYGKGMDPSFAQRWRARADAAGGGILLDQGIHLLDLISYLSGAALGVAAARAARHSADHEVEDEVFALLDGDGVTASLHSSHTQWRPRFALDVGLSGGSIQLRGLLSRTGRYGPETLTYGTSEQLMRLPPAGEQRVYTEDESWRREVDEFAAAVTGAAPLMHGTPDEALALMQLVARIYDAARVAGSQGKGSANGLH